MDIEKKRLRIVMLGEALERPGGVVTVEKAMLAAAPNRLSFHHIDTLPSDGRFGQLHKLVTLVAAIIALVSRFITHRVDVVHIHVSMGASVPRKCLLAQIAFLFAKPVVMHTHGGAFAEQFPTMPKPLQAFVEATFKRCSAVITLTETWRTFYVEALGIDPARATVLKNPIRLPKRLPPSPPSPPIHFLYLGMLSEAKGAFDLIAAMAVLDEADRANLHLTMAGHGDLDQAHARIRAEGLDDSVTLLGWVDSAERDALLADSHVFALPSHFEGLPMALLEAMSFGIASIATPVGGVPDVLRHEENGLLVPVGDPAVLAAAMLRLARDGALRRRLGENARMSVEPYSADGYGDALVEVYRNVIDGGALVSA